MNLTSSTSTTCCQRLLLFILLMVDLGHLSSVMAVAGTSRRRSAPMNANLKARLTQVGRIVFLFVSSSQNKVNLRHHRKISVRPVVLVLPKLRQQLLMERVPVEFAPNSIQHVTQIVPNNLQFPTRTFKKI